MNLHVTIKGILDAIWNEGQTPQLMVDSRMPTVVIPEDIRKKWGVQLAIDLRASYPLNLVTDDAGLSVDLAFAGRIVRCTFPWASIYGVNIKETKKVVLIRANVPADLVSQKVDTRPGDALHEVQKTVDAHYAKPSKLGHMKTSRGEVMAAPAGRQAPALAREAPTRKFQVIKGGKA